MARLWHGADAGPAAARSADALIYIWVTSAIRRVRAWRMPVGSRELPEQAVVSRGSGESAPRPEAPGGAVPSSGMAPRASIWAWKIARPSRICLVLASVRTGEVVCVGDGEFSPRDLAAEDEGDDPAGHVRVDAGERDGLDVQAGRTRPLALQTVGLGALVFLGSNRCDLVGLRGLEPRISSLSGCRQDRRDDAIGPLTWPSAVMWVRLLPGFHLHLPAQGPFSPLSGCPAHGSRGQPCGTGIGSRQLSGGARVRTRS